MSGSVVFNPSSTGRIGRYNQEEIKAALTSIDAVSNGGNGNGSVEQSEISNLNTSVNPVESAHLLSAMQSFITPVKPLKLDDTIDPNDKRTDVQKIELLMEIAANPITRYVPTDINVTGKYTPTGNPIVVVNNPFAEAFPANDAVRKPVVEISYDGGLTTVDSFDIQKVDSANYGIPLNNEQEAVALLEPAFVNYVNTESVTNKTDRMFQSIVKDGNNVILSGDKARLPFEYNVQSSNDLAQWLLRTDGTREEVGQTFKITLPVTDPVKEFYRISFNKPETNNIILGAKLEKIR